MSKLAHSNDETMAIVAQQAADEPIYPNKHLEWFQHFLDYGNHKFDCAGNDGTVCECGYLQIWQKAFDACQSTP